jgi:hypothetical protein
VGSRRLIIYPKKYAATSRGLGVQNLHELNKEHL